MNKLPNIQPGEVLLKEFLEPMALSQNALARATDVPRCGWRRPSAPANASGWACRPTTTSRKRGTRWALR